MQEKLFNEGDLSNHIISQPGQVQKYVDQISKDQLLNTPEDDLVEHCVQILEIEPLTIYEDRKEQDHSETMIDVSDDPRRHTRGDGPCYVTGIRIRITVPFTGDSDLWLISPHAFYMSPRPLGRILAEFKSTHGTLEMEFEFPTDEDPDKIRNHVEENFGYLRNCLSSQKEQIDEYNSKLPDVVLHAVRARLTHLQKHDKIANLLGIPLKKKLGAPEISPLPLKKKIVTQLPPPPTGGFKPEPGILDEVYENILRIIRHVGRTCEVTPHTYIIHPEEELRDILLAHLNGHYEGDASGETFRKSGKTDIRIEDKDRAAFIAECKVWEGSKKLNDGIDQLLGYLTWRDCKTAVIVFNKNNANFSELLTKIPDVFKTHSRQMKEVDIKEQGEWRFVFRSQDDDARLIHIHVFVFNLYVKEHKKAQQQNSTDATN